MDFDAIPTSAGISRATTRTVVHSSLAVLGLDFVLRRTDVWELSSCKREKNEIWVGVFLLLALLTALFICLRAADITSVPNRLIASMPLSTISEG